MQLLTPSRFDIVSLGKLYEEIDLGVIPEIGALPGSEIRAENFTEFPPGVSILKQLAILTGALQKAFHLRA